MKKLRLVWVILIVLSILGQALAEKPAEDNGVEALFARLHKEHQALHRLDSLVDSQSKPSMQCVFPSQPPESILSCFDLLIDEERTLPKDMNQAYDLFLEIFFTAENISRGNTGAAIVNLEKYDAQYGKKVLQVMPGTDWWLSIPGKDYQGLVIPFFFTDEAGAMIDDHTYFMAVLSVGKKTQIWICSDQALVKEMLMTAHPVTIGSQDDSITNALDAWLSGAQSIRNEQIIENASTEQNAYVGIIFAPPKDATEDPPIAAPDVETKIEEPRIGVVTVIAKNTINLRAEPSEKSKRVSNSSNGRSYVCLGVAENGWYRILLKNGGVAYVAPSLVSFAKDDAE